MSNLFTALGLCDESEFSRNCIKCNSSFPIEQMAKRSKKQYRNECRSCTNKLTREREALKKLFPLKNPKSHICPICKKTHDQVLGRGGKSHKTPWAIDHNHKTGKYRNYLCHDCNRGIGNFLESTELLTNALNYLQEHA